MDREFITTEPLGFIHSFVQQVVGPVGASPCSGC